MRSIATSIQDVQAWAEEVHAVGITNGGSLFQPRRCIEIGMSDIHRRIVTAGHFRGIGPDSFAEGAGPLQSNAGDGGCGDQSPIALKTPHSGGSE